jgi:hypothetical protein
LGVLQRLEGVWKAYGFRTNARRGGGALTFGGESTDQGAEMRGSADSLEQCLSYFSSPFPF